MFRYKGNTFFLAHGLHPGTWVTLSFGCFAVGKNRASLVRGWEDRALQECNLSAQLVRGLRMHRSPGWLGHAEGREASARSQPQPWPKR
jgi:hypothetical protein